MDESIEKKCRLGTLQLIEPLYTARLQNPQKRDRDELMVECFIRKGLAGRDYTAAEWKKDQQTQHPPFKTDDPRFTACLANPAA